MTPAPDDYGWLTSDEARPWLALAGERANQRGKDSVRLVAELRRSLSPARVHLVVEQAELRARAKDKFPLADRMFFTRKGLEQASDESLAAYKAGRFPAGGDVADLCCGIGGDLLALAGRGPAVGVEREPAIAHLAAANCRAAGVNAAVRLGDVADFPLGDVAAWHIYPDRRPLGRRTTHVELHKPSLAALEQMLRLNPAAAIKLAPAAEVPATWADRAQREWIGSRGECRQQVLWFGKLARQGGPHAATIADCVGGARTIVGRPDCEIATALRLGRYLYEPHNAVLAAHLEVALAAEHKLEAVTPRVAYFTSDVLARDPALAAFEVLDALPLDQKRLKAYFRERDVGRLEVKKRGVEIDPEKLRRAVVGAGDVALTLLACRISGHVQAIIARRLPDD